VSRLEYSGDAKPPTLVASKVLPDPSAQASEADPPKSARLGRVRAYRGAQGTRIVRGDSIAIPKSVRRIGDGRCEDMWRYRGST